MMIAIFEINNKICRLFHENIHEEMERVYPSLPYLLIEESDLPDEKYRDAWVIVDGSVVIDESKKRDLIPPVTRAQALKALYRSNKIDAVSNAINAVGGEAKIDWENAAMFHRDSPLVNAITQGLGWSENEVNELFELAATL